MVLSPQNRERCIKKLNRMKPIEMSHEKNLEKRNAAVLFPLCIVDGQLSVLYTQRSFALKVNRGQVAFPGGMEERKVDSNLEMTALRETQEEIGIMKETVNIWGPGPQIGRNDLTVTPYLGFLENFDMRLLTLNLDEVNKVFTVSIEHLCHPSNFRYTQFRSKSGGYTIPVFLGAEERIWGLTAIITHIILSALIPELYTHKIRSSTFVSMSLPSVLFAGFGFEFLTCIV